MMGQSTVGNTLSPVDMAVAESLDAPIPRHEVRLVHFLAWGVHLYTALGLVLAAAIAVLLVQGGVVAFRWSFLLMVVATLIDATDGTLARRSGSRRCCPTSTAGSWTTSPTS